MTASSNDVLVDRGGAAGNVIPRELARTQAPSDREVLPEPFVLEHGAQGVRQLLGVLRIDEQAGVPDDLGQRRHRGRDYGNAGRHRLKRRDAEPLVQRWIREHRGEPVEPWEVVVADESEAPNAV